MKALLGCVAAAALVGTLAGCSMCQAPFDCCNPVIGPNGLLNCDWNARRGSAFHPMEEYPPPRGIVPAKAAVATEYGEGTIADPGPDGDPPAVDAR
jgi:hypothetical protein